ncbi:C2 domain-containing protein [Emericellopsis atlantica]|uniref:C2 domain-containing protein n=1 Tax=Emericellopsis atlantica TaxID=2614577 RepID=A0A9P8CPX7_9HYPO|nr:C2 domain-containing protein [Emericellopsis atlantica]KAG9254565.1 C2 domain-containing protein [Emericellopsis atlantica]
MAAKTKHNPLNAPHTAGIYADLSIDGPDIGTLVAIVDRAKNLPNRKTIGKQDPYCAARLGKEAKKTATDIRGGQTPKWDQELRFKVHEGPDYLQLKISVFTDDKRTDLIGEAWIDLKDIIVPGGGQGDIWQTLTCRQKYAGEIRLEITYYDTRPKPEKLIAKPRAQQASTEGDNGSTRQRGPVKRRPLPSDPVTGEAPPQPAAGAPLPAPVAPPVQAPASAPPPQAPAPMAPPVQEQYHTPPRAHAKHASHSGYVTNNSPLQSIEYQTPPSAPRYQHPDQYAHHHSGSRVEPLRQPQRQYDERDHSPRGQPLPEHYDFLPSTRDDHRHQPAPAEYDRPPPPPAHRSAFPGGHEVVHSRSFEAPVQRGSPMDMRHDVLRNEAHRHSIAAQPVSRPVFRPYDSAPATNAIQPPAAPVYEEVQPRHQSYDASYDTHPRSMQATVEDVPESPNYGQGYRRSSRARPEDSNYDPASSPAPLNLSRSPGPSPMHQSPGRLEYDDLRYQPARSPAATQELSTSPGRDPYYQPSSQPPSQQAQYPPYDDEFSHHMRRPSNSGLYEPPASLVPGGVDPSLALELADRIQEDRRQDRRYTTQVSGTPPRGRYGSEPPPPTQAYGNDVMVPYGYSHPPQPSPDRRHGSDVTYSNVQEQRMVHRPSPSPPGTSHHVIKRKSVSPAPPPSDSRRKSDVPFGPDSFDAYNTTIDNSREEAAGPDPNAKIVMHDGREVDPSDHLPVESWAPEPEPKPHQASPEPRARPAPSGAQPMPPSGRRQLRIAARPAPQPAAAPPHPSYGPQEPHTPPTTTGRNRLHKKTRSSAAHSPAAMGSSPLALMENHQDRHSPYTPTRGSQRPPHHYDYPNENQYSAGPPIPAKVPMHPSGGAMMSGANGADMALMHEMQNIDLGTGRSRRRGGY